MNKMTRLRNDTLMIFVVIGLLAIGTVFLYSVSLILNPLLLLLILPAWILYSVSKQYILKEELALISLVILAGVVRKKQMKRVE